MFLGAFKRSADTIRVIVRTINASTGALAAPTGDVTLRSWSDAGLDTTTTAAQLDSRTGIYFKDITASGLAASVRTISATYTVAGVDQKFDYTLQLY